jgi:hypothetical protein
VRVFKNKWFTRFARKEGLTDAQLCEAVLRAERRLIDADLGGDLIKQRIARKGQGKSGGYRAFIAYRPAERAFFVFGFPKSERRDVDDKELEALKDAAAELHGLSDDMVERAIENEILSEVRCDA